MSNLLFAFNVAHELQLSEMVEVPGGSMYDPVDQVNWRDADCKVLATTSLNSYCVGQGIGNGPSAHTAGPCGTQCYQTAPVLPDYQYCYQCECSVCTD